MGAALMEDNLEWENKFLSTIKALRKKSYQKKAFIDMRQLILSPVHTTKDSFSRAFRGLNAFVDLFIFNFDHVPINSILEEMKFDINYIKDHVDGTFDDKFAQNLEMKIFRLDNISFTKKERIEEFLVPFHELCQTSLPAYTGQNFKISQTIANQGKSVLITPLDPREARVFLFNDKVRSVFAEYGGKESAESYVAEMYGSNGKFFQHYSEFLNCKQKYHSQKHSLG